MKKIRSIFLHSISITTLLFSLVTSYGANAQTVNLAIGDWAPYTSSKADEGKIAEIIVKEAFALEGISVQYSYYPWKRSYHRVLNGESDGTFPWYSNEKRESEMIVNKVALIKEQEVFFYRKELNFNWSGFDDLKPYKVGGTIGYSHIELLTGHGVKVSPAATDLSNFKKLHSGRIDLFPSSKLVGQSLISKSFSKESAAELTYHKKPLSEGAMFILFSRKTSDGQHLSDTFDKGLNKLKESGRYQEIIGE